MSECRLIVADHFDCVTSEIDFFIETELQATAGHEMKSTELNKKRDILLGEVKKAETTNLANLNESLVTSLNSSSTGDIAVLFGVFCFVFTFEKRINLIVSDGGYLTKRQLDIFRGLLDSACFEKGELCFKPVKEECLAQLFEFIPVDFMVHIIHYLFIHFKYNLFF